MKPSKIIIATAALILLSSFLSGCDIFSKSEESVRPSAAEKSIQLARQVKKSVTFKLQAERDKSQVRVKIVLQNPDAKPITSVQSWLTYDPKVLKGSKIDVLSSPFSLTAPYDNTFDPVNGLVMVGRSNPDPVLDKTIPVAEVVFDILQNTTTMVEAYDYREDLSGHISANVMEEGLPYNILIKPESPALVVEGAAVKRTPKINK